MKSLLTAVFHTHNTVQKSATMDRIFLDNEPSHDDISYIDDNRPENVLLSLPIPGSQKDEMFQENEFVPCTPPKREILQTIPESPRLHLTGNNHSGVLKIPVPVPDLQLQPSALESSLKNYNILQRKNYSNTIIFCP